MRVERFTLLEVEVTDGDRYWPFKVLPYEERTQLHHQQLKYLENAYLKGFKPYMFFTENFASSSSNRAAFIVRRTRQFWELKLTASSEQGISAYVSGFEVCAEAELKWLQGDDHAGDLEFVRPSLVAVGSRSSGFVFCVATGRIDFHMRFSIADLEQFRSSSDVDRFTDEFLHEERQGDWPETATWIWRPG